MTKVRVRFFGPFRNIFGSREIEVELPPGARIRELLRQLGDSPERAKEIFAAADVVQPYLVIITNGRPISKPDDLEAPLRDGDTIAIFSFMGGG